MHREKHRGHLACLPTLLTQGRATLHGSQNAPLHMHQISHFSVWFHTAVG